MKGDKGYFDGHPTPRERHRYWRALEINRWRTADRRALSDADILAEALQLAREEDLLLDEVRHGNDVTAPLAWAALDLLQLELDEVERISRGRARAASRTGRRVPGDSRIGDKFDAARQLDLVDVITTIAGVDPVRRGESHWVRCPFHGGGHEKTPSLQIYPTSERGWFCHACHAGGDAVAFVSELKGMSRVSALLFLETLYDLPLGETGVI